MSVLKLSSRTLLAFGAAVILSACATDRTFGAAQSIEVANLEELPPPLMDNLYLIGPQVALEIEVVGAERLSGTYLTDGDGRISFPLVGLLSLDGLAPNDAADLITDVLRGDYLRRPEVRVIPIDIPPPTVSVGGQVNKPGEFPVFGKQSLIRVVNQAGGMAEYAREDDVLIIRTVEGQRYIGAYNLGAIQRGNYADPVVYPNDIVIVGDSPNRRRLDSILQYAPLLSSSAILIDRIGQ
ncbi:polysaccharide biosynthesis/export family protein [Qipengyuania flava]|uniref:polysaccharide biosynthesis/export family protein n=1 Tax=Qipengyuania flava TaxID=192812 RepID=UPI001C595C3A|nr:polysaccharide biosynthesis/export family protein [Qipengyuania flava]MBW3168685.1 polysaccharide biosynthesis/export family protein [Qipengyuania flava]MBY5965923.1 polysaccharide biosynthesis/export family protein [Qipengyuania flava]MBY6012247.1 polysaccharide biosynthesis/export family protein [Qipengyuania flava]MBY6026689.1 polysaccharide biosynthesis/export family protein [Qipengyuania flava]